MEYLSAPSSDLRISRVALGTMTFGDQVDRDHAAEMLEICAASEVNLLDTANSYSAGLGEQVLGELLPSFEDRFLLIGKVGGIPNIDAPDVAPLSAEAVRKGVEGSLRRLGREHLDIFLLHHPDRSTPLGETVGEIGKLIAEGKIRAYGASNFSSWRYSELVWTARAAGLPEPEFAEPLYNLISRRLEDEYVEYSNQHGLINIVFNPLAGGLLTGKYSQGQSSAAGGRFASVERGDMYRDRYWKDSVFVAIAALSAIASEAGLSLIELALRWLYGRPAVGAILVGASSPAQLRTNLSAIEGPPLDEHTLARCDEVWETVRGDAPPYSH